MQRERRISRRRLVDRSCRAFGAVVGAGLIAACRQGPGANVTGAPSPRPVATPVGVAAGGPAVSAGQTPGREATAPTSSTSSTPATPPERPRAAALVANLGSSWTDLDYTPAPADNPLKGFMPYAGAYQSFPYSMEWSYLPLRQLMTGAHRFTWDALDNLLATVASRGHQAVFRVYLDYPTKPTGIPQFLLDSGLAVHHYTDQSNQTSVSPNYEDPHLQAVLQEFVAALGSRYDGDARLGFVEMGLLGFWGEWHTDPHPEWFASTATQGLVLRAYLDAFHQTRVLVRYPQSDTTGMPIGYHDDSFAYATLPPPDTNFVGKLDAIGATENWKSQPVGGELRPELQPCIWNDPSCAPAGQAYDDCVDGTHASWLLNQQVFADQLQPDAATRALAGARRLGYEFSVSSVKLAPITATGTFQAHVQVRNTGRAPFYYHWPVQLAAIGDAGPVATWDTPLRLPTLLPGAVDTELVFQPGSDSLPTGGYYLAMRVMQPLRNGKPLRFANATQDASLPGWLTLGIMRIER